tara:strand:- start:3426 stop:3611 length:186 start_codon:yes stop_codon:yes gene_type:complete
MAKKGRPLTSNPSKKALYMREYMRKYNKNKSDKINGVKAGEYFMQRIIDGFKKFLESPFHK